MFLTVSQTVCKRLEINYLLLIYSNTSVDVLQDFAKGAPTDREKCR